MTSTGSIVISLENVSLEQTERYRKIIHLLFEAGVFGVKNGKAILHFDSLSELQQVELDFIRWRKGKESSTAALKSVKISTLSPLAQKELDAIMN